MKLLNNIYQKAVCSRADDNGAIFYFSAADFAGLRQKNYAFHSSDGHILQGYFYFYENYKSNHIIVFDHGMGGGHRSYMREIEVLAKEGYLVFSYDHTGCMESGGETTGGFPQSLKDLNDALTALKADFPNHTFSVIGHSWGGFSTMNIAAFHPDVKHLIAFSGFISVEQVLKQFFGVFCKGIYKEVLQKEPVYAASSAVESLKNTDAKILIFHSGDDHTVSSKMHFDVLAEAFAEKENVRLIKVNGKKHNPNYTADAVQYKDAFFAAYKKTAKKLKTEQQKQAFKDQFDWYRMTEQDMEIWSQVFEVLKS
ncbi:MAG: alpha/beta fold hydrolase [Clostridia bacterium]|nr:alpha/beta fold hydrolase [Clostridia bacterium]